MDDSIVTIDDSQSDSLTVATNQFCMALESIIFVDDYLVGAMFLFAG